MERLNTVLPVNAAILKQAQEAVSTVDYKVPEKVREQMVQAAAREEKAWQSLSSVIAPRVRLNVLADTMALDFFQYRLLKDDDMPEFVSESDMPTAINIISEQGGQPTQVWTGEQNIVSWPLAYYTSAKTYVPLLSLEHGNIDETERAKKRAAYDLQQKIDVDLMSVLAASLGAFPASTWILDSRIKDMPTTNDLDWSATCNGELTKDFWVLLFDHFDRLGLKVKNIYVPSTIPKTMWKWVSVVSGFDGGATQPGNTIDPSTQREIFRDGSVSRIFGHTFNMVTKNTLDGTTVGEKYIWVSTTEPAGFFFDKPALARNWNITDREPFHRGFASIMAVGQAIPDPYRPRFARIKIG